jgi:hypothetical protein
LSRDLCSKSFLESHFQYGFNSLGNGSWRHSESSWDIRGKTK